MSIVARRKTELGFTLVEMLARVACCGCCHGSGYRVYAYSSDSAI
jgi:hypothetical protein